VAESVIFAPQNERISLMVGEKKFRKWIPWVSFLLLGLTILLVTQIRNLQFDYNFEKFYPSNDDDTRFFLDLRENFESDNDFLLVAIPAENGCFDPKLLKRVDRFTKQLEKDTLVQYVLSITNQEEVFLLQGGATARKPYINFNDLDRSRDSLRVFKNKELINTMVSEDGKALGIFIRHQDYLSKKKGDILIADIRDTAKECGIKRIVLGGRTIGQQYYIEVMSYEMILFLALSAGLVVIFLFIAFRSIWGILVPQVVILTGMLWLIGGMALFGEPINIILTVLPSIMFVVSMSDTIHLVSRYLDALRAEQDKFKAIMIAIREVGLATFLTSLTTAVGFFTLYFVRVQPVQIFGVVMGLGVMLAFVLTFVSLPILFYYFPGPKHVVYQKKDHFWKKSLEKWFIAVMRNPKRILWISGGVTAVCLVGALQIQANNYLMDDVDPDEPIKKDFDFMDAHFGGVRPFTLVVGIRDTTKSVWDLELLNELDRVENFLMDSLDVHVRTSLVSSLKMLNRGANLGDPEDYALPESKTKLRNYRRSLKIAGQGKVLKAVLDSNERTLLINGIMPDVGNLEFKKREEKLNAFLDQNTSGAMKYRITGSAFLIDKNMNYLAISMVQGLLLSIVIVAVIMGLIYRSWRMMVISLIPNLIPLVIIAGIMGYTGIELKTSTAIIFTIAFGIAVDDTIHYLGKFKYELMKGRGKMYALKRSYLTTGKAMILTTLILCSGFLLLVLSSFMGTFYMGILLSITLFVALIADMTVLPALMMLFFKEKPQKEGLDK
jgi:hypothetical protein